MISLSPAEERLARDLATQARHRLTLEELFTGPHGFGITTASPLQRAVCRIIDGLPLDDLDGHPDVIEAFGCSPRLSAPPAEVALIAAVRSGKSVIAAARGVEQTQIADVRGLVAGEVPRVSIQSVAKDQAQVIYGYIRALVEEKPYWRSRLVKEPTADTVTLYHPSGRPIEIKVTAGRRAGSSLVARWSAGVIFDEAPRMIGAEDGVVNLTDARRAVRPRMLPNTSILYPGSPWAPFGPVYDMWRASFGEPSHRLVVCRAPGWLLNPHKWTPEACEQMRREDPDVYETDVAANFADQVISYLPGEQVEACVKTKGQAQDPPRPGWHYVAAMDPATRGNAWTLGVGAIDEVGRRHVVLAVQWQGSSVAPLRTDEMFERIATAIRPYGVARVHTDQWSFDAMAVEGARHGVFLDQVPSMPAEHFGSLRTWIVDGTVVLPDVRGLVDDLKRVQRRVTQRGISIDLPRTNDGRHCDYAAMVSLLLTRHMPPPETRYVEPGNRTARGIEQSLIDEIEQESEGWRNDI